MPSQQMVQHQQLLHVRLWNIHLLDQLRLQLQFQSYLRCRHHHLRLHLQLPLRPSQLHFYLHGTPAMMGNLLLRRSLNHLRLRDFHLLIHIQFHLSLHLHLQLHLAPHLHAPVSTFSSLHLLDQLGPSEPRQWKTRCTREMR